MSASYRSVSHLLILQTKHLSPTYEPTPVRTVETISEVRSNVKQARAAGQSVGLVPTMGALHAGHLALLEAARPRDDFVVISIFVNPTQFVAGEDYQQYPRQLASDEEIAQAAGVDLIFAPAREEIYPQGFATNVTVAGLTEGLCGRFRSGHFEGVTTVVAKLLTIVGPDRAYFGEKDYQQLIVIRRMVEDLNIPVEVIGLPTVREADGLAVSSRNQYLSPEQRAAAPRLYEALQRGAKLARQGATGSEAEEIVKETLGKEPQFRVQYVEAVEPATLELRGGAGAPMVIAAAVYLSNTRLIDNIRAKEGNTNA